MSGFTLDMIRKAQELELLLTSYRKGLKALKTSPDTLISIMIRNDNREQIYVNMNLVSVAGMLETQISTLEGILRQMGVDPTDNDL
jgi:uncharacterized phage protein gp47/JayE